MSNALTITDEQTEFTSQQKQALQALGIGAVTPADLQIFLSTCQRTGLNPFFKQIYLISRKDKYSPNGYKSTIQVGIDGLKSIARRTVMKTGEKFGVAPILWCGTDGVWRDVWLSPQAPAAAKAVVKRGEGTFTEIALFREFAAVKDGRLSGMWAKIPAHMIGKVAMAHALRSAFPIEMSGVYTNDEMEQAGPAAPVQQVQAQAATAPQPVAQPQPVKAVPVQAKPVQTPAKPAQKPAATPVQAPEPAAAPAPAKPVAAPVQRAHWTTHRVDPWAMPAPTTPATETPAEGEDWRRHVQQPAKPVQTQAKPAATQPAAKPAVKPAQSATQRNTWGQNLKDYDAQQMAQWAKPAAKNAKEGTK